MVKVLILLTTCWCYWAYQSFYFYFDYTYKPGVTDDVIGI